MTLRISAVVVLQAILVAYGFVQVRGQTFTEWRYHGITDLYSAGADWADMDKDNYPDVVVCGANDIGTSATLYTRVFKNKAGSGNFTLVQSLPGVNHGSCKWGDYNNDEYLDILVTGSNTVTATTTSHIAKVYRNNGGTSFSDIGASLSGVYYGTGVWADYNKDNHDDLVITGELGTGGCYAGVYQSDGTSITIDVTLAGKCFSSAAWGDYNNDNWIDLVITGGTTNQASVLSTSLYKNTSPGSLSGVATTGLPGAMTGSIAWSDFDNDLDLDILLVGSFYNIGISSIVYENTGGNVFSDIGASLPGIQHGNGAWGDYDSDGAPDILLNGAHNGGPGYAYVYNNDMVRSGNFTLIAWSNGTNPTSIRGGENGVGLWADNDRDQTLDFLTIGYPFGTGSYAKTRLYMVSVSPSPSATRSSTPTRTGTPTATHTATATATKTATASATRTATASNTRSATSSVTPTGSMSISLSASTSPSATRSVSPTQTATSSVSATQSASPSVSPSGTATASVSFSSSSSSTASCSVSPTVSPTQTATSSASPTHTASPSVSPTASASFSPTTSVSLTSSASSTASGTMPASGSSSSSVSPSSSSTSSVSSSVTSSASESPRQTVSASVSATATISLAITTTSATTSPSASVPSPSASATLNPSVEATTSPSISTIGSPSASSTITAGSTPSPSMIPSAGASSGCCHCGANSGDVEVGDFDNDGLLDVAVWKKGELGLYYGSGDFTFEGIYFNAD